MKRVILLLAILILVLFYCGLQIRRRDLYLPAITLVKFLKAIRILVKIEIMNTKLTLTAMTEIIGRTKNETIKALNKDFSDFEDAVQYPSALTIRGVDVLITRNIKY